MNIENQNEMLRLYLEQMDEVKRRLFIINDLIGKDHEDYRVERNIEIIALQTRIILELIALGNLVLNKEKYTRMNSKFKKSWNAKNILKDIERLNKDFYPVPLVKEDPSKKIKETNLDIKKDDYLTKKDFIKCYDRLGSILHARNPFSGKRDYHEIETMLLKNLDKIMKLLDIHSIQIFDGYLFLIEMDIYQNKHAIGHILQEDPPLPNNLSDRITSIYKKIADYITHLF